MLVRVSTRHGNLSEASQEKVTKKVEKLQRIFDRLTEIQVVIDVEDESKPTVEIQASAEHKHDFVASEQAGEMMAALDAAMHKIESQLRKYKEKLVDRHRDRDREGRMLEGEYTEGDD